MTAHLPALADIADTYGTGAATVNLSIAGYAVAAVAAEATSGALADRYGRRRVVLVSITVLVAAHGWGLGRSTSGQASPTSRHTRTREAATTATTTTT
ncbi:MFS transporter [Nocardiopsis sp. NPDC006938]|uniref:MFS transporter n=1 Tax=Nocardiopsis sp. NPDC006938 TaxID=3364337 RepID=UPI0036C21865